MWCAYPGVALKQFSSNNSVVLISNMRLCQKSCDFSIAYPHQYYNSYSKDALDLFIDTEYQGGRPTSKFPIRIFKNCDFNLLSNLYEIFT